jgi:D-glutamate cyclase
MNIKEKLKVIRDIIQVDVGNRGLRKDPQENLINATLFDFGAACQSFANIKEGNVAIVTGFTIPKVDPPRAETDGPLGALFLARALNAMGMKILLVTDKYCLNALKTALSGLHSGHSIRLFEVPLEEDKEIVVQNFRKTAGLLTHLIAIERPGPSHTPDSIASQLEGTARIVDMYRRDIPSGHHDRCHTMKGFDIEHLTSPTHWLFEADSPRLAEVTIGIGDGGNEIGMGKIAWDTIRKNIPNGGMVACRIPTDYLIVSGISNWGGYALAAGVALVRNQKLDPKLFDIEEERKILEQMVQSGPLIDGVSGEQTTSVDGLPFEEYVKPLTQIHEMVEKTN